MVVMISAFATADTAVEAMKEGAYDYIPKPFKVREFKNIIKDTLKSRKNNGPRNQQNSNNDLFVHRFDYMMGESPQMRKVYDLIERVAETKSNILISGESGTGKELTARAIHSQSPRKDRPFVVINCAGIPENLIESELFGFEKGAFTGASIKKKGLFEVANNGTIFLDEIGDMSMLTQSKLLRVLQEKELERVGGSETINVDVRVVSAANRDLEEAIQEGTFREDLYYRLNVFNIHIPPLRERKEALPVLAQQILSRIAEQR